jgi:hypothetical protein
MNCFNHQNVNAVALCKNCSKGICRECIEEFENGVACKETCVEQAKGITRLIAKNVKCNSKYDADYSKITLGSATFTFLFGSAFLLFGFFSQSRVQLFLITLGIIFLLSSFHTFYQMRKAMDQKKSEDGNEKN